MDENSRGNFIDQMMELVDRLLKQYEQERHDASEPSHTEVPDRNPDTPRT